MTYLCAVVSVGPERAAKHDHPILKQGQWYRVWRLQGREKERREKATDA